MRTLMAAAVLGLGLTFALAPVTAPPARADGIERPRAKKPAVRSAPRARPAPRLTPPAPAMPGTPPVYVPIEAPAPTSLTLPDSFFAGGDAGGVGAHLDGGCACGGGGRVFLVSRPGGAGSSVGGGFSGFGGRPAFFAGGKGGC